MYNNTIIHYHVLKTRKSVRTTAQDCCYAIAGCCYCRTGDCCLDTLLSRSYRDDGHSTVQCIRTTVFSSVYNTLRSICWTTAWDTTSNLSINISHNNSPVKEAKKMYAYSLRKRWVILIEFTWFWVSSWFAHPLSVSFSSQTLYLLSLCSHFSFCLCVSSPLFLTTTSCSNFVL